jgi:hypothetical protein
VESTPSVIRHIFTNFQGPGENIVKNSGFDSENLYWDFYTGGSANGRVSFEEGKAKITIEQPGSEYYDIQLIQRDIPLYQGRRYYFEFQAQATKDRIIEAKIVKDGSPWTNYGKIGPTYIRKREQTYSYEFIMEDNTDLRARIVFNFGTDTADVILDNVMLYYESGLDLEPSSEKAASNFELYQNRPNPFNPVTVIPCLLKNAGDVDFEVFDVTGKRVHSLYVPGMQPGNHTLTFNASGLASGVYFYRMIFHSPSATRHSKLRKMIILK